MGVTEFYYLEGGLFFGFLVAAGLTVISLGRPDYRVARRCAWGAAILFASIAVVWGIATVEPAWIRILAVGVAGFIAAVSLTEALRFIKNREFPAQPSVTNVAAPPITRGPTLEATGDSIINASAASIPGDLPFQFARAASGSVIDIAGINVTRNGGTITIRPGSAPPRAFPAPSGEFSGLSNFQLAIRAEVISDGLRAFQKRFQEDARNLPRNQNRIEFYCF